VPIDRDRKTTLGRRAPHRQECSSAIARASVPQVRRPHRSPLPHPGSGQTRLHRETEPIRPPNSRGDSTRCNRVGASPAAVSPQLVRKTGHFLRMSGPDRQHAARARVVAGTLTELGPTAGGRSAAIAVLGLSS
jgi:hypothetical protein